MSLPASWPRGNRSSVEVKHDLAPVYVIAAAFSLGDEKPTIVRDDSGQLLVFAYREDGAMCVAALLETGLFERLTVVPVWWAFVAQTLLAADGRDAAGLASGEVKEITTRASIVEPGSLSDVEAEERARDLARRVVLGLQRQVGRVLRDAADINF